MSHILNASEARLGTKSQQEVEKRKIDNHVEFVCLYIKQQMERGYYDYTTSADSDKAFIGNVGDRLTELGFSVEVSENQTNRQISECHIGEGNTGNISTYRREYMYRLHISWA